MSAAFNRSARLTHLALHVKDIGQSIEFYKTWCDMDVIQQHESDIEGQPVTWLATPGEADHFVLVLVPGNEGDAKPAGEGMRHIGFALDSREAVETLADKAEETGIIHWGLQTHSWPVGTLFSVTDPDGNIIEFSHGQPLGPDFHSNPDRNGQRP